MNKQHTEEDEMIQVTNPTEQQMAAVEAKLSQFSPLPAGFAFGDKAAWASYLTDNHEHLTCKACYATETEQGWWVGSGDVYCWDCSWQMTQELGDVDFTHVETPEQRETRLAWDAQGIGSN